MTYETDVPADMRKELMKCASATGISYEWLCTVYRRGKEAGDSKLRTAVEKLRHIQKEAGDFFAGGE